MATKEELLDQYIGDTFPFMIQEALEQQEYRLQMARDAGVDAQILEKEEKMLNIMLSQDFKDSLMSAYREGLQSFTETDLQTAVSLRSFERKSEELVGKMRETFQKLLSA